jgi:hypothetical protein
MSFTLGRTSTTSSSGTASADNKYYGSWVAPATGYIKELLAYLHVISGSHYVRLGVYGPAATLSSTTPLLCEGNAAVAVANTSAAWKSVAVDGLPLVTVNQKYHLACLCSGDVEIHRNTTGGASGYAGDAYSNGFETVFGSIAATRVYNYCFYAVCVQKQSLSAGLSGSGLVAVEFAPAAGLAAELLASGTLTANLIAGRMLTGRLEGVGLAEAAMLKTAFLAGELLGTGALSGLLRGSGRFWDTKPVTIEHCPRCGFRLPDRLFTRCPACRLTLGKTDFYT